MKILLMLAVFISSVAFAQSDNEVTPTPTQNVEEHNDVKGTLAPPTPEQKAQVVKPVKKAHTKATAKHKHSAVKKAKKAKKHKKTKKVTG